MAVLESDPAVAALHAAPQLVVTLAAVGPVLPQYDDHPARPLDLAGLRLLAGASSEHGLVPTDVAHDQRGLLDHLVAAGLLGPAGAARTAEPPLDPVVPADRGPIPESQELVAPIPVLARCRRGRFEVISHEGQLRAALGPEELLALLAFARPRTVAAAAAVHREQVGEAALDDGALDDLIQRLVGLELLVPFDPDLPEHARKSREAQRFRDRLARQARVHQAFDRIEAEHDAAGVPTDAVRIIGYHTAWAGLPASLGMILAAAKAHDGGALTTAYDFRPRLVWDADRFAAAASGPPAVFLFSNYIWSTTPNLTASRQVKQANPHHVTIHGGPNTPKYRGDVEDWFAANPHVDIAVHGEGEATFPELLAALRGHIGDGPPDLSPLEAVPGLSFRLGDRVITTEGRDRIADLDTIPSPVLTGLFDGFIPAGGDGSGLILETNRGCPYGCTFCDWGSATLSRVRKFDLDRVFAELEWCAKHHLGVGLADANFGIFERDVAIAEKIAELKATYGYPKVVGNNYAKNTVKHLSRIIEIFTDAGITAEGKMSMQTFDEGTLTTIRRKNIKVEKYHDLSVEFRRNALPLAVEIMMGLPGATPDSFRRDLQSCIDRDVRAGVYPTVLLPNSPMNDPEYREANGITARPGEEIRSTASYTSEQYDTMVQLRFAFYLFENFGILRHVLRFARAETGTREIDLYEQLIGDVRADPDRWPMLAVTLRVLPHMMVPPVSWSLLVAEVRDYLTDVVGLADDSALATVLRVQHLLLPTKDRALPITEELAHDYVAWNDAVLTAREGGHEADWPDHVTPLRELGPGSLTVEDPLDTCSRGMGFPAMSILYYDSAWDLTSPVSRARQQLPEDAVGAPV